MISCMPDSLWLAFAVCVAAPNPSRRSNEALQQMKPAFTTIGAVFTAERRCSADSLWAWALGCPAADDG